MPIDWSNNARQLSAADFGAYDLMKALSSGQQFGQKQQMFPEELREAQLLNAIKKVQAQYAEPNAKQALIKAQQENEWNPQIWKSEIGLRNAQVPYYGAQTNKINAEMPYIGRTAQADLIEGGAAGTVDIDCKTNSQSKSTNGFFKRKRF